MTLKKYIIVIKDLDRGWEFLECVDGRVGLPRWSWHVEDAQQFHRKSAAQHVLNKIKVLSNCQQAVLYPVDVASMSTAIRRSQ